MKSFVFLIMIMALAACAGTGRQAAHNVWPSDPEERSAAERVYAKTLGRPVGVMPPGLDFTFREIVEKQILDHFDYRLDQLDGADLLNAVRENVASNFIDDLSLSACRDPDIRFLLNNGFDYEFRMRIFGSKGTSTASNKMDKGFCVASDLPLANQNAIESRFEKVRHWPNGDRVDPRLVERVMGLFQVAAAKHEPPDVDGLALKTTNLEAEGLMLSFYIAKEQKNTIKQSKYWPQNFKGRILAKRCTSKASLAAITVGAVFRYSIEFLSNKEVLEHVVFTVSYPDCLLYNKKP